MNDMINSVKEYIKPMIADLSIMNIIIIICLSYIIANIISILDIRINYSF